VALYPLSYTGTSDECDSGQHASTAHAADLLAAAMSRQRVYVH